ncbi:MAG: transcription elongation factor GreA, partial [Candidatus Uhrbacteria bacterium]|nr:transcription elongation factor GreA [Candidatus Uhrbacteria bacterium]
MDSTYTYISASGLQQLKDELINRTKVLRMEIAQKICDAKEMGDLSENFAYHEAKEQQAQNETRISILQDMIVNAVVVEEKHGGAIGLGSTFTVTSPTGERQYEIVGENEADPMAGKISNVSPLGSAFMGKGTGDSVDVTVPSGVITYKIV